MISFNNFYKKWVYYDRIFMNYLIYICWIVIEYYWSKFFFSVDGDRIFIYVYICGLVRKISWIYFYFFLYVLCWCLNRIFLINGKWSLFLKYRVNFIWIILILVVFKRIGYMVEVVIFYYKWGYDRSFDFLWVLWNNFLIFCCL